MSNEDHPVALFRCGQFLSAPVAISESGQVYITGMEWGPDNRTLRIRGWVYQLRAVPVGGFPVSKDGNVWPAGKTFQATEEEISLWAAVPQEQRP